MPKTFTKVREFVRGTHDEPGRIVIQVRRVGDNGRVVRGATTRTVTVIGASVGEVYSRVHRSLFGSNAE